MQHGSLIAGVAASLAACGVTTLGIWAISGHEEWARENSVQRTRPWARSELR